MAQTAPSPDTPCSGPHECDLNRLRGRIAVSQCSPSGPAFSEPHTTCSRALQQSRASPQQSICSKPHMPSKLVAATNVPDKDINKPPTRVILWPSVIDSFDRGGCRHAAGNAREPGGSVKWGAPKAEIRNTATTTSRCVGSDKVVSRSCDRPAIISTRNETSARPHRLPHAYSFLNSPGSCGTLAAICRASSRVSIFAVATLGRLLPRNKSSRAFDRCCPSRQSTHQTRLTRAAGSGVASLRRD